MKAELKRRLMLSTVGAWDAPRPRFIAARVPDGVLLVLRIAGIVALTWPVTTGPWL